MSRIEKRRLSVPDEQAIGIWSVLRFLSTNDTLPASSLPPCNNCSAWLSSYMVVGCIALGLLRFFGQDRCFGLSRSIFQEFLLTASFANSIDVVAMDFTFDLIEDLLLAFDSLVLVALRLYHY